MSSNNNPTGSTPSGKNPSNIPSSNRTPDNTPDDIRVTLRLAFRTITTMLDFFQRSSVDGQYKPMTKKDLNTDPDQYHLQLLSALSIVLVRQHEVVSVVSRRSSDSLDLLACSQLDVDPNNLTTNSANNRDKYGETFYVTANPCIVNPKGRSKENEAHIVVNDVLRYCDQRPRIRKPWPELIEAVTLENTIMYMYTIQSGQPFEDHAEIIIHLLRQ